MRRIIKRIIQLLANPLILITYRLRKHVILHFFSRVNKSTVLEGYNKIGKSVISSSFIGTGSYVGDNCLLSNTRIGRFCSIGSNVKVLSATHPTSRFVSTHPCFFSTLKQAGFSFVEKSLFEETLFFDRNNNVVADIGNDVWIGDDVTIIGGIRIGNGAVIGTGSIITKDVPSYSVVGGSPACIKKYRFPTDIVNELERIEWWNKDMRWLLANSQYFSDIESFLTHVSQ